MIVPMSQTGQAGTFPISTQTEAPGVKERASKAEANSNVSRSNCSQVMPAHAPSRRS
jgi:hypothetical protein